MNKLKNNYKLQALRRHVKKQRIKQIRVGTAGVNQITWTMKRLTVALRRIAHWRNDSLMLLMPRSCSS
jgi:hypothetical protein